MTVSSVATAVWRVGFAALGRMAAPYICPDIGMEFCGFIVVMTTEIVAPLVAVTGPAWTASQHGYRWDVRHFISGYTGGILARCAYLFIFSGIVYQLPADSWIRSELFYQLTSSMVEGLGATIGFNLWPMRNPGSSFNNTEEALEASIQLASF